MGQFLAIAGCGLALLSLARAADRPNVLVLSDQVSPEAIELIKPQFAGGIRLDPSSSQTLTTEGLLARLQALPREEPANLLLLSAHPSSGSLKDEAERIRQIVRLAREHKQSLLWINAPGKEAEEFNKAVETVLNEEDVSLLDYARFSTRPTRPNWTPAQNQAELLAEALGQWWWVLAPDNEHMIRERLWADKPPQYQRLGADLVNYCGRVQRISQPEIARFRSDTKPSGTALIYFPGGGYSYLGFLRNVDGLGAKLSPLGITVFALKYRTGRGGDIPLIDGQRAVRWVRSHASELGLDPQRIGVAGISAGANLVLSLLAHSTSGDPAAADPLDRVSSRPDFAVVLTSWSFGAKKSPFVFAPGLPPIFLRHARDDAGFPLAEDVVAQLQSVNAPLNFRYLEKGGHGAFDLGQDGLGQDWPEEFVPWLKEHHLFSASAP